MAMLARPAVFSGQICPRNALRAGICGSLVHTSSRLSLDMAEALIGFASGVGVSVIAALFTSLLERRRIARSRIEQTLFDVYMLLLELDHYYFWIASCELHKRKADSDIKAKVKRLAWRIADRLRAEDRVPLPRRYPRCTNARGGV